MKREGTLRFFVLSLEADAPNEIEAHVFGQTLQLLWAICSELYCRCGMWRLCRAVQYSRAQIPRAERRVTGGSRDTPAGSFSERTVRSNHLISSPQALESERLVRCARAISHCYSSWKHRSNSGKQCVFVNEEAGNRLLYCREEKATISWYTVQ